MNIGDQLIDAIAGRVTATLATKQPEKRLLDRRGAAHYMSTSPDTIDRMRSEGVLRAVEIRGCIRFDVLDLDRLIEMSKER